MIKITKPLLQKAFFGCANGLSGKPNSKTIEEPNEAAIKYPSVLL